MLRSSDSMRSECVILFDALVVSIISNTSLVKSLTHSLPPGLPVWTNQNRCCQSTRHPIKCRWAIGHNEKNAAPLLQQSTIASCSVYCLMYVRRTLGQVCSLPAAGTSRDPSVWRTFHWVSARHYSDVIITRSLNWPMMCDSITMGRRVGSHGFLGHLFFGIYTTVHSNVWTPWQRWRHAICFVAW